MYPPCIEVIDQRFTKLVIPNVHIEKLHTGSRWNEGPVYVPAGRYFLWSDIPNNRMLRWDETDGSVSVFRQPSNHTNGHTIDHQGRLVSCEHLGRCIARTEHDGSRTVLVSHYEGKRLNSPNDLVVKSDGTIWFTDPSYGIDSEYEGDASPSEIGKRLVFRYDPATDDLTVIADDFTQPNGLAFSPDESLLYIVDSGVTHVTDGPKHIRVFEVDKGGAGISGGRVFAECQCGMFDGFRVDTAGNLWAGAGDGVHCYAPDGTLIGKILVPEVVSNVVFGGPKRNRLFMTATTSIYVIYLFAQGAYKIGG